MSAKRNQTKPGRSSRRGNTEQLDNSSLRNYLLEGLKDIYWAEKHLVRELPKMEKAATTDALKDTIAEHLAVTEEQVGKLDEVFSLLGEKPQTRRCEAMEGLTDEASRVISETEKGSLTRDAAIIIAAQKVEHYEIATYGGLAQIARTLGENQAAALLDDLLQEEKEADRSLTDVAEEHVNEEAMMEEEEAGEE